jgi:hypothetical protein
VSQGSILHKTQHSQQTDIYALGGIRTRNTSKRVIAYICPRPLGHWDWLIKLFMAINSKIMRWAGYVTRSVQTRNLCNIFVGIVKGKHHLQNLNVEGDVRTAVKEIVCRIWPGFKCFSIEYNSGILLIG